MPPAATSSIFDEFYAEWRALSKPKGQILPLRSALQPTRIKNLLPYFFLVEKTGQEVIVNKIIGTELDQRLGRNYTGSRVIDAYRPTQRRYLYDFYDCLANTPVGAHFTRKVTHEEGDSFMHDTLIFPLLAKDLEPRYFAGVATISKTFDQTPAEARAKEYREAFITSLEYLDVGAGLPENPPSVELHNSAYGSTLTLGPT
ncbi:MAG: PAS domain-containing protein [Sphingomonadales bacterium]